MARDKAANGASPESVISIIGPGMKVVGDCTTDGTIRIEGAVEGEVSAGKAVVIGRDGSVSGSVNTQDAVVAGTIVGSLVVESRLEVQATSRIEGQVYARRLQLEEGAVLNGTVEMGERAPKKADAQSGQPAATPPGSGQGQGQGQPQPQGQGQGEGPAKPQTQAQPPGQTSQPPAGAPAAPSAARP